MIKNLARVSSNQVINIFMLQIRKKTRSGVEGKSALEIPKEVQSAGVPANITSTNELKMKYLEQFATNICQSNQTKPCVPIFWDRLCD